MVKTFYPIQTSFSILDYFCQSTTFDYNSDLGDVYNKKNLWFSTTPDEGLQLFFEYLGSKEYTTQNGFSKKVPELKLFYADKDSLGDKKITIDDLYFFFEDLNLAQ